MATELLNDKSYETRENVRRQFYKNRITKDNIKLELDENESQDKRRKLLLEYQKKHREEALNAARGILQDIYFSELEDEEYMDTEEHSSSSKLQYRSKINRMMMSEWMLDVPQDFSENWIMVPCPVGKRVRLVSGRGKTRAYSRTGVFVAVFSSALPGGNYNANMRHSAIIDAIWIKERKVYYVLDVLYWNNLPFTYCEAEFRLYWINSKLSETKEFEIHDSDINKYPMLSLPKISCDLNLSSVLTDLAPELHSLDGFLFYHRNAQYIFGITPLVIWLKPYMLSEALGIFVPSPFDNKPDKYVNFQHHVESVNKKRKKGKIVINIMEVEEM
ncbi:snurportin-1 [Linepithema humile]|uniref:snurportin-1 n=1 Tax=Linepithema humile TaxID=83485 RepID=UPI00351F133D